MGGGMGGGSGDISVRTRHFSLLPTYVRMRGVGVRRGRAPPPLNCPKGWAGKDRPGCARRLPSSCAPAASLGQAGLGPAHTAITHAPPPRPVLRPTHRAGHDTPSQAGPCPIPPAPRPPHPSPSPRGCSGAVSLACAACRPRPSPRSWPLRASWPVATAAATPSPGTSTGAWVVGGWMVPLCVRCVCTQQAPTPRCERRRGRAAAGEGGCSSYTPFCTVRHRGPPVLLHM